MEFLGRRHDCKTQSSTAICNNASDHFHWYLEDFLARVEILSRTPRPIDQCKVSQSSAIILCNVYFRSSLMFLSLSQGFVQLCRFRSIERSHLSEQGDVKPQSSLKWSSEQNNCAYVCCCVLLRPAGRGSRVGNNKNTLKCSINVLTNN